MLASFDIGQHTSNAQTFTRRQYPEEVLADVLNKDNSELMEYCHLIGNPKYRTLWRKSYGKNLGRLAQDRPVQVKGTGTIFFIDKADIPAY